MAITALAHAGGFSSKTAGTTLALAADTAVVAGTLYVVMTTFDNLSATTPTITIDVPGGESAAWTYVHMDSPQAAAGAGVRGAIAYILTTVSWASFAPTITYSGSITAKCAAYYAYSGASTTLRVAADTNPQTAAINRTVSGLQVGDLCLGLASSEQANTLGGVSSTPTLTDFTQDGTTGAGGTSNCAQVTLGLILPSGTTYNITASAITDGGSTIVVLQPSSGGTPVSGTDAGAGADAATLAAGLTGTDTGTGAGVGALATTNTATDTASGANAASVGVTAPDTGSGANTSTLVASLSAPDTGGGTDAGALAASLSAAETAAGVDGASVSTGTNVSSSDTATAANAATLAAGLTATDTAVGVGVATLAATRTATDTATGADTASVSTATAVSASDTAHATDTAAVSSPPTSPIVTLTGDLDHFLTGYSKARAYLLPAKIATAAGGQVRIGSWQLTLDTGNAFTVTSLPSGTYRLRVDYFQTTGWRPTTWTSPAFTVTSDNDLSVLLP